MVQMGLPSRPTAVRFLTGRAVLGNGEALLRARVAESRSLDALPSASASVSPWVCRLCSAASVADGFPRFHESELEGGSETWEGESMSSWPII